MTKLEVGYIWKAKTLRGGHFGQVKRLRGVILEGVGIERGHFLEGGEIEGGDLGQVRIFRGGFFTAERSSSIFEAFFHF